MAGESIERTDELAGLIDALKQEGIDRGREESDAIVADAKREATRIVEEARTEAERILETAQAEAAETMRHLDQQLTLALRDFLLKVRGELTTLVALEPLRKKVDEAFADPDFIKKLIDEIITGFAKRESSQQAQHLNITIPKGMEGAFIKEWIRLMRDKLNVPATLHAEAGLSGFKLSAEGVGGELIVDTNAIIEELKPFVSERFRSILDRGELPTE